MFSRMIVAAMLTWFASLSHAETRYGLGVSTGNFSVEDPDGGAETVSETVLFGVMTLPVNRNYPLWRYWFEVGYRSFELEPSQTEVGQKVDSIKLDAQFQRGFNVSTHFRPWVGVGVGVDLSDYADRHTVDQDGYLKDHFSDRSETGIHGLLNAGIASRQFDAGFVLGASLTYEVPFGDTVESSTLNVFFLY